MPDDPASPLHPAQKVDRPHIIYNEQTRKYVCWLKVMGERFGTVSAAFINNAS